MTYSCAYFRRPSDTLEQAQRQKVEHTLRKLDSGALTQEEFELEKQKILGA